MTEENVQIWTQCRTSEPILLGRGILLNVPCGSAVFQLYPDVDVPIVTTQYFLIIKHGSKHAHAEHVRV